jgi:hypothetical protein
VSRFLLVVMEEDLAALYTNHDGVLISIQCVNGVQSVTDLACLSPQTLEQWMLPRQLSLVSAPKKKRKES